MSSRCKLIATSVVRGTQQGDSHGGVYVIDFENRQVHQTLDWNTLDIDFQGRGWDRGLRGIAFDDDDIYIAASDELFVFDPDFQRRASYRNPYLKHAHEICRHGRNLFVTSTGFNAVLAFDLDARQFKFGLVVAGADNAWRAATFDPRDDNGPAAANVHHINNVYCDDSGMYLSGRGTGTLLRFNGKELHPWCTLPTGVHNAQPHADGVLFNDTTSDVLRFVTRDQQTAFRVPRFDEAQLTHTDLDDSSLARQAFARGLCVLNDGRIAVGSSPSTVTLYNLEARRQEQTVTLTMDVRNAIHGLEQWPFSNRPTMVRWRILALLVFASFVSYVLRYNLSTAGPTMMADLKLSEIQFGWILAAFTAGYTVFQFPGGILVDAIGSRRTLAIIMLLWGLLTLLTSAVPDADTSSVTTVIIALMAVRFLVGAVHAPIYPLTGGVVERWFPLGSWALPNGLSSTGLTLGTAATAPLLAWLMLEYGWRISFAMLAPAGFIGSALWWWYARDNPHEHRAINDLEVALIRANRPPVAAATDGGPVWLRVLKNRNVLLLTLSYFCMNYVFYQMFNWVFYYLVTIREFASQEAGFLTSFQWIAAAVGATLGGLICDGLTRRRGLAQGCRWPAVGGMVLSGGFLIVGAMSGNAYLAVACIAASFFFNQLTEAAFWAAAIGIGGRHAAAACGVMNTGGNAVGFFNALLVPLIAQSVGWTAALASGAVFALVGAALWIVIRADQPIEN